MTEMQHPTAERLEAFVEGVLEESDRVLVARHLPGCARCRGAIEEWRSLFAALSTLPPLEPSFGFADRVMAGVRVGTAAGWQRSWQSAWRQHAARAGALAARAAPSSTFGWGLVTALLALPVILGGGALAWLVSQSQLTPQTAWAYTSGAIVDGLQGFGATVLSVVLSSDVAAWALARATEFVSTAGMTGVGALMAAAGLTTMLSIWILYRNLFRTPTRESNYATFSF